MPKSKGRTARAESAQRQGSGGRRPKAWSRAGVLGAVSVGVIALGAAFSVPASAAPVTAASGAAAASFKIFNPPTNSGLPSGSAEAPTGIYAASPTDVWAVGVPGATDAFEHWNGTSWTGQALPAGIATAPGNSAGVSSITGTSASNITAVGTADINTGGTIVAESVAFHFNGTAWSEMTIPANVTLGPVLAFSATNLWSVNDNGNAEHFNGTTWTTTSLPVPTTEPNLDMTSISGSSPSDIWAAGTEFNEGLHRDNSPVLEHFNGTSWSNVSVPVSSPTGGLTDVVDISPTDAYAITTVGAILQWNGTTWTLLNATTQTGAAVTGSEVAALSPTDVWIAGLTGPSVDTVTLYNFNGTTWTSLPAVTGTGLTPAGQTLAAPDAAAAVGPGTVWFAGNTFTANGNELPYALGTSNG
jgi:hypothetical protein